MPANDSQAKDKKVSFSTIYLTVSILFMILFIALYKGDGTSEPVEIKDKKPSSANQSSYALTVEEANKYVGTTLRTFCLNHKKYINIKLYYSSEKIGAGAMKCDEVGKGYYFDDFIITQAYYDEKYLNSSEYKYQQTRCEEDDNWCEPLTVYVDSVPQDEAVKMGIKIKQQ